MMAGSSGEGKVGPDARGKGDAVWVLPSTAYVPATPQTSLQELIPANDQLKAAKQALKSFTSAESEDSRRTAIELARQVLGGSQGSPRRRSPRRTSRSTRANTTGWRRTFRLSWLRRGEIA